MDKVKIVLAGMKKYHFWVLCLLVIVFGVVVWNIATADISKQYTKLKSKRNRALQSTRSIANETDHPNEKTNQNLVDQHKAQRLKVLEGWRALHEKQKKENPWPKTILTQQFLDSVNSRKPGDPIKRQYREMYRNFIKYYLPKIFEIVDYRHPVLIEDDETTDATAKRPLSPAKRGPGMDRKTAGAGYRIVGIVDWDESDRMRISKNFFWARTPTTTQVLMAQEDIWVYKALLGIIKATNEGATSHYNAAIKKIGVLEIGQPAAQAVASDGANLTAAISGAGRKMGMGMGGPGMGGSGMGGPGDEMGMRMGGPGMGGPGMGGPGMAGGAGGTALKPEDVVVLNGRYVDKNKMPIMAAAEHPYAEFKMMPIRMSIIIDPSKIPKLLIECANSTMPVEVQRIRINPSEGLGASASRGMGGRGMGGRGMAVGMGMGMEDDMGGPGMGGMRRSPMGAGKETAQVHKQEVPVEIVGIIYIYNPPDLAKVGTGSAMEDATATPGN